MAIADIIGRIGGDATAEAARLVDSAEAQSEEMVSKARDEAQRAAEQTLARAKERAAADAATMRATARLAARDRELQVKRDLSQRALDGVVDALGALPEADYVGLLARAIAASARGGESVRLAEADAGLVKALRVATEKAAPGLSLVWSDEPAGIDRGAVLEGRRVRADLSLAALVGERREQLSLVIADVLFGTARGA